MLSVPKVHIHTPHVNVPIINLKMLIQLISNFDFPVLQYLSEDQICMLKMCKAKVRISCSLQQSRGKPNTHICTCVLYDAMNQIRTTENWVEQIVKYLGAMPEDPL